MVQLHDFPAPPPLYRPQADEPALLSAERVRVITGFSGAGKTFWVSQAALHTVGDVFYFNVGAHSECGTGKHGFPRACRASLWRGVVISVGNQDLTLMPGMTADAQIVIDQRENVVRVPNAALHYTPSDIHNRAIEEQVWVLRDNQATAIPVAVGLGDDSFTQIVSGDVKPGDQVITADENSASDRVTVPRL